MSLTDILLAGGIIVGALYLLYRSIWKKRGFCPGCDAHTCGVDRKDQQPTLRRNENGQTD